MSNYGAVYILAALPRTANGRQVRVLIALETFRCDADGWRSVGQAKLAETAGIRLDTLKRARAELLEQKLIEYRPGRGKGILSRYRILVTPLDKGAPADPFSAVSKRGQASLQKGAGKSPKGGTRKPDRSTVSAGQALEISRSPQTPALEAEASALAEAEASAAVTAFATPDGATAATAGVCDLCGDWTASRFTHPSDKCLAVCIDCARGHRDELLNTAKAEAFRAVGLAYEPWQQPARTGERDGETDGAAAPLPSRAW